MRKCASCDVSALRLLDALTALAACCGFDLCHKYMLYLYLYLYLGTTRRETNRRGGELVGGVGQRGPGFCRMCARYLKRSFNSRVHSASTKWHAEKTNRLAAEMRNTRNAMIIMSHVNVGAFMA